MNKIIPIKDMKFKENNLKEYAFRFITYKYNSTYEHIECTSPIIVNSGFIKWNDNPHNWGGAWEKNYVLFTIKDYSYTSELKSEKELHASYLNYVETSIYNFPYRIQELYNDKIYYEGSLCSNSSVTKKQKEYFLSLMSEDEIIEYYKKFDEEYNSMVMDISDQCYERPIKFSLYGTDDVSYGLSLKSVEIAQNILNDLINNPSWYNLHSKGFIFTN